MADEAKYANKADEWDKTTTLSAAVGQTKAAWLSVAVVVITAVKRQGRV
jgi:hypothetical protein